MKFYFLTTNTIFKLCACTSLWMQITCSWLVINCLYSTSLLTHKILEQQYFILVLHSNQNSLSSFTFTAVTWNRLWDLQRSIQWVNGDIFLGTKRFDTSRNNYYFPAKNSDDWLFTSVSPWTSVTWCSGTGEISFTFISLDRPVRGNTCQLWSWVTECGPG